MKRAIQRAAAAVLLVAVLSSAACSKEGDCPDRKGGCNMPSNAPNDQGGFPASDQGGAFPN